MKKAFILLPLLALLINAGTASAQVAESPEWASKIKAEVPMQCPQVAFRSAGRPHTVERSGSDIDRELVLLCCLGSAIWAFRKDQLISSLFGCHTLLPSEVKTDSFNINRCW